MFPPIPAKGSIGEKNNSSLKGNYKMGGVSKAYDPRRLYGTIKKPNANYTYSKYYKLFIRKILYNIKLKYNIRKT